ncbi:MAG: AAA family ATPase [Bacteroidales bacterium]|nr:AAA family ATPase [Bacteroidales bacterium]
MALSTVEQIYQCIDERESFILDAGAGSGKTWSLIESLKYILDKESDSLIRNNQKIVCITYTNVAKNEIIGRLEHNELVMVSTIHDFLWSCISQFKKELKAKFVESIDEKIVKIQSELDKSKSKKGVTYEKNLEKKEKLINDKDELINSDKKTQYKNSFSYKNNIISHDEVIDLSIRIFSSYEMIKKLIVDTYPIIFIDEYQDTFPKVINILLDYLLPTKSILLGFFGDKMQKIYDTGIGEIPTSYNLKQITKSENYRCSASVINILNKIRDDIKQVPSGENKNVEGSCSFYPKDKDGFKLNDFIENELKNKIGIDDDKSNVKVLYLTHRLIAKENSYEELYELVNSAGKADALTKKDEDKCPFIKFLYQVEELNSLCQNNQVQTLLKKSSFEINSFKDKTHLKNLLMRLHLMREKNNIEEIYNYAIQNNLLQKSQQIIDFDLVDIDNKAYCDALMQIEYNQIIQANKVVEEHTPFSTKHGTKGAEYDNVLVVIDDDAWRNYSFDKYFSCDTTNESIYNRTKNLFYVVCSRAKINLVVLALSPLTQTSQQEIEQLFGGSYI